MLGCGRFLLCWSCLGWEEEEELIVVGVFVWVFGEQEEM